MTKPSFVNTHRDVGDVVQNVIHDLGFGTIQPIGRDLPVENTDPDDTISMAVVIPLRNTKRYVSKTNDAPAHHASKTNDAPAIRQQLSKTATTQMLISAENFNDVADVIFNAVKDNDFADLKIPKSMLNECLCGAAAGNHKHLIHEFIFNGATNIQRAVACAAEFNHRELVELLITEYNITEFNYGLAGAARGGYLMMMDLFIKKGADDYEWAMEYAARGGHVKCVEFCISRGAHNWYRALDGALKSKSQKLIDFFTKKIDKERRDAGTLFIHDFKIYDPRKNGCQVCTKHSTAFGKYKSLTTEYPVMCLDCLHEFNKSHDTTICGWKFEFRFTFPSESNI